MTRYENGDGNVNGIDSDHVDDELSYLIQFV